MGNRSERLIGVAVAATLTVVGCNAVFGVDELDYAPPFHAGGAGGESSSTSESGAGMPSSCEPGTSVPCYDGQPGTEGQGPCIGGKKTCQGDGLGYGDCVGQVVPAFDDCATEADDDCDGELTEECTGEVDWALSYGDELVQEGHVIARDSEGNVIIAGHYNGTIDFVNPLTCTVTGRADSCLFVAKFSATGKPAWAVSLGAPTSLVVSDAVAGSEGETYISGTFSGEFNLQVDTLVSTGGKDVAFVMSVDAEGFVVWGRAFNSEKTVRAFGLALTSEALYVTGFFESDVDFGGGLIQPPDDANKPYVLRLDLEGNYQDLYYFDSGDGSTKFRAVAVDDDGNIIVAGAAYSPVDFGGGTVGFADGNNHALVLSLDSDGVHQASQVFAGSNDAEVYDLGRDASGTISLVGDFNGTLTIGSDVLEHAGIFFSKSMFVAQLDEDGTPLRATSYSADGRVSPQGLAIDPAGNLIIGGFYAGAMTFDGTALLGGGGSEALIAKLDPDLATVWVHGFNGSGEQIISGVVSDDVGGVFAVGLFESTLPILNPPLTTVNEAADLFVTHFAP